MPRSRRPEGGERAAPDRELVTARRGLVRAERRAAARPADPAAQLDLGRRRFRLGRFDAAAAAFRRAAQLAPADPGARLGLARVALLRSRLGPAGRHLAAALPRRDDAEVRRLLGRLAYRRREYAAAAEHYRRAGGPAAQIAKLASFAADEPYRLAGAGRGELPFVAAEPLPAVEIEVAGRPLIAVIDTGAGELILDPEVARGAGAVEFGARQGSFAADHRAPFVEARVGAARLGGVEVADVPVQLLPTRRFSAVYGGALSIGGIVGAGLLLRLGAVLDYPAGRLLVGGGGGDAAAGGGSTAGVPVRCFVDGHHALLAAGRLNGGRSMLFFVDSGLAGAAFAAPPEVVAEAGIPAPARLDQGLGGGEGAVPFGVFPVAALSLGRLRRRDLVGIGGALTSGFLWSRGFRVDGLVSHQFLSAYAWGFDLDRGRLLAYRPAPAGGGASAGG